jgi:hypothetical protein
MYSFWPEPKPSASPAMKSTRVVIKAITNPINKKRLLLRHISRLARYNEMDRLIASIIASWV